MFRKTLLATALLALCGLTSVASAAANPATTTFQVKLTINKACSVTATNLDFGTQDATATNFAQTTAGTVTVTCSKKTAYIVGLVPSNTNAVGAGVMAGTISGNADTVAYQLYQNAALSTVWGNTGTLTAPGNEVAGTGTGAAATALSVYSKVAAANVTPDAYADTVTVNVTY
jgi:spore coat protein U-like protein